MAFVRITGPPGPVLMGIDMDPRVPPDGLIICKHYEGSEEWLEIVSAMPRAMFSAELLHEVRRGASLDISLDKLGIGGLLRIRGRDRTVLYRLVAHQFELDIWFGEWPD